MLKKSIAVIVAVVLIVCITSGCQININTNSSSSSAAETLPRYTPGTESKKGTSSGSTSSDNDNTDSAPDIPDTPQGEDLPAQDETDSPIPIPQKITGFGDIPSTYHFSDGLMSAPKSTITIRPNGAYHAETTRLTNSHDSNDSGSPNMEMNGTFTSLVKGEEDYIYTCQVATSDSNNIPAGQTVTFLLQGAPVSALPDKQYPPAITGYEDGKLTVVHLYFEHQNAIYVAVP